MISPPAGVRIWLAAGMVKYTGDLKDQRRQEYKPDNQFRRHDTLIGRAD